MIPGDQEWLDAFKERATPLGARLQEHPLERPVFVEFSGSPKSGKSTCIDIVAHLYRRLGFKVLAPTEGASKRTPYFLKDDLVAFNTWSACYALNHVLEGIYHSDSYDISILDRGLFDALVWFELLAIQDAITIEERGAIQQFLLVPKWRSVIDDVFLFRADAATSMVRENADKLISEPGRAMNPEFLRVLNEAYDTAAEKYSGDFSHFRRIDTSSGNGTTPTSTAAEVASEILDLLEKASNA